MKVLDPGHSYALKHVDGDDGQNLFFVKREGPGYPGNVGSYPGTQIQEVLRVCIDRLDYVNNQIPCDRNKIAKRYLQEAIFHLESRAAERHGRVLQANAEGIEKLPICPYCGHIECDKHGKEAKT